MLKRLYGLPHGSALSVTTDDEMIEIYLEENVSYPTVRLICHINNEVICIV